MKTKILSLLLAVTMLVSIFPTVSMAENLEQAVPDSDLTWTVNDTELYIEGTGAIPDYSSANPAPWNSYKTSITSITVGEGITRVGSYAFTGFSAVEKMALPESLTSIGNSTFNGCKLLKGVCIPKNVKTIGWSAFYGCLALESVEMWSNVASIGASAFNGCRNLQYVYYYGSEEQFASITVAANNTYLTNAKITYIDKSYVDEGECGVDVRWWLDNDGVLNIEGSGAMTDYSSAAATPWYNYKNEIVEIVVYDGVTRVGSYAFLGLSYVTSVLLPDSLTSIGNSSFNGCKALTEIYIPEYVKTIGWSAFYGCTSLKSVNLWSGITSIGASAFNGCRSLGYVTFNGTQEQWNSITFGANNAPIQNAEIIYEYEPEVPADFKITVMNEDGTVCDIIYVTPGSAIGTLPEPEYIEGKNFVAWLDEAGVEVNELTVPASDLTLWPIYDAAMYKVYVYINGEFSESYMAKYGSYLYEYLPEAPYIDGYEFDGWFNDDGTAIREDQVITDDTTVNAVYSKVETNLHYIEIKYESLDVPFSYYQVGGEELDNYLRRKVRVTYYDSNGESMLLDREGYMMSYKLVGKTEAIAVISYLDCEPICLNLILNEEPENPDTPGGGGEVVTSPRILISEECAKPGEEFTVKMTLEHNPGVAVLGFSVNYDSDAMSLVGANIVGVFNEADMIPGNLERNPYMVSIANYSENFGGDGDFLELTFVANDDCVSGNYEITLSDIEAYTIDEDWVDFTGISSNVQIISMHNVWFECDGMDMGEFSIESGKTIGEVIGELPEAPEKYGYTFVGWYDAADIEVTVDTVITSDMHFYAKYEVVEWDVVFVVDGMEYWRASMPHGSCIGDTTHIIPEKEGYIFNGWYDEFGNEVTSNTFVESDMRIYAEYDVIVLNVIFRVDGKDYQTVSVEYGNSISNNLLYAPHKEGYEFVGWTTDDGFDFDENTVVYEDTYVYAQYRLVITDEVIGIEAIDADGDVIKFLSVPYGTDIDEIADTIKSMISVNEIKADGSLNTNVDFEIDPFETRADICIIRAGEFETELLLSYETRDPYIAVSEDEVRVSFEHFNNISDIELIKYVCDAANVTAYDQYGSVDIDAQYDAQYQHQFGFVEIYGEMYESVYIDVIILDRDATPVIKVDEVINEPGSTVAVKVKVDANPGVAILAFDVNYDNEALKLTDVSVDGVFDETDVTEGDYSKAVYTVNAANFDSNKFGNGTFVTLYFQIGENSVEGVYDIILDNVEAYNIDEELVEFCVENGVVEVCMFKPGDVTSDGEVDRVDYLRLGKYFAGWNVEINQKTADVTADGKVNKMDLLRIAKFFSGWDVSLGR